MKGQPIMKHSPDLIGCVVQVYRNDFTSPRTPRAGIITGFNQDEGLFEIMIFHSYAVDQRQSGLPPIGLLSRCLVIDDPDDLPVGVLEYAVLKNAIVASSPARLAQALLLRRGEETTEQEAAIPDAENDPADSDDGDDDAPTSQAEVDMEEAQRIHEEQKQDPPVPAETPAIAMLKSPEMRWIQDTQFDFVDVTEAGDNEITIQRADESKPLVRMIYKAYAPEIDDWGWTFKARDKTGRCTIKLGEAIKTPPEAKRVMAVVSKAVLAALSSDADDWQSSAANMASVIHNA